ncbi:MAG: hypothetical protein R3C70_00260 [Geminicoccaceae bacterium]
MVGRDSREDIDAYGLWPWLFGCGLSAVLIWLMFTLAKSIS